MKCTWYGRGICNALKGGVYALNCDDDSKCLGTTECEVYAHLKRNGLVKPYITLYAADGTPVHLVPHVKNGVAKYTRVTPTEHGYKPCHEELV